MCLHCNICTVFSSAVFIWQPAILKNLPRKRKGNIQAGEQGELVIYVASKQVDAWPKQSPQNLSIKRFDWLTDWLELTLPEWCLLPCLLGRNACLPAWSVWVFMLNSYIESLCFFFFYFFFPSLLLDLIYCSQHCPNNRRRYVIESRLRIETIMDLYHFLVFLQRQQDLLNTLTKKVPFFQCVRKLSSKEKNVSCFDIL